jgi:hypothetical protein
MKTLIKYIGITALLIIAWLFIAIIMAVIIKNFGVFTCFIAIIVTGLVICIYELLK